MRCERERGVFRDAHAPVGLSDGEAVDRETICQTIIYGNKTDRVNQPHQDTEAVDWGNEERGQVHLHRHRPEQERRRRVRQHALRLHLR